MKEPNTEPSSQSHLESTHVSLTRGTLPNHRQAAGVSVDETERISATPIQVTVKHRALKHLEKRLREPTTQSLIRAKYPGVWDQLVVDIGKTTHAISGSVLTLRFNKPAEIEQLLKPASNGEQPAQPKQSITSQLFSDALAALRVMLHEGLEGRLPKDAVKSLSTLMEQIREGTETQKAIFDEAMRLYSEYHLPENRATRLVLGTPLSHYQRMISQCQSDAITSDTQKSFRAFLQAFCRAFPVDTYSSLLNQATSAASKVFHHTSYPSIEKAAEDIPVRNEALNQLVAIGLLANESTLRRLNNTISSHVDRYYAQFMSTVKNSFFGALSLNDLDSAQRVLSQLRQYSSKLLTPGAYQYVLTLQSNSEVTQSSAISMLRRLLLETDMFLANHQELLKSLLTEEAAFHIVEETAEPSFDWVADQKSTSSLIPPTDVERCAQAIAQVALANGGPLSQTFCEIIFEVLGANSDLKEPTLPVQVFCMLGSFKPYCELIANELSPFGNQMRTLLGWALMGTLDIIASDLSRRIENSLHTAPFSDIEDHFRRLSTVLELLQRPTLSSPQAKQMLAVRHNSMSHKVESRRFMEHIESKDIEKAVSSLSQMRALRNSFQMQSNSALGDEFTWEESATRHLCDTASELIKTALDSGDIREAIAQLQSASRASDKLPDDLRIAFEANVRAAQNECLQVINEYWDVAMQPSVNQAGLFLMRRKRDKDLKSHLSPGELECLSGITSAVSEIEEILFTLPDKQVAQVNTTVLNNLYDRLAALRHRYTFIVSEWISVGDASVILKK